MMVTLLANRAEERVARARATSLVARDLKRDPVSPWLVVYRQYLDRFREYDSDR